MATLAPLYTPARQPFGVLDSSKLRSLQSVKNRQNAIAPSSAPSLKRRAETPENSDSENVDPNLLAFLSKRKRTATDDDVSLSKHPRHTLTTTPISRPQRPIATPKSRVNTFIKPQVPPTSAPPAAGRSPPRVKKQGVPPSRKRFAPPAFSVKSPALSITAALNGTLANKKCKKAQRIQETQPRSWSFDIFEETEETQDYRMNEWTMTQSATSLDISNDEGKSAERADKGKENVDPNEASVTMTRSMAAAAKVNTKVSRKDMMTDEVRTPLGDLSPSEYYAKGLDATSVVLVHDEDAEETQTTIEPSPAEEVAQEAGCTFTVPLDVAQQDLTTEDIGALIMASAPVWEDISLVPVESDSFSQASTCAQSNVEEPTEIQIWESESAKDENERDNGEVEVEITALATVNSEEISNENAFILQEL